MPNDIEAQDEDKSLRTAIVQLLFQIEGNELPKPYAVFDYSMHGVGLTKRYVVRDLRDPDSPTWDRVVHTGSEKAYAEALCNSLIKEHFAERIVALVRANDNPEPVNTARP
jgi:hypothetical protein